MERCRSTAALRHFRTVGAMAASAPPHQSWEAATEITWPQSLTDFLSDPSKKKLAPFCSIKTPTEMMH